MRLEPDVHIWTLPYVALFWFSWNNPDPFTPQHPSTPEVHMTHASVPYQERKEEVPGNQNMEGCQGRGAAVRLTD